MPRFDITIPTRNGTCPAGIFISAEGNGPWPAVIFYMDAFGLRPVFWEMAQRLANAGYLVLLPDLFYRLGPRPPQDPAQVRSDPKLSEVLMKSVGSYNRDFKISDTAAFIEFLSAYPEVKGKRFAATGYCMGGNTALTVAGAFPDRFAAIASFHGGHLATDEPDSPHLFVKNIIARVYVAGADEDTHFTEEQKNRLEQALTAAGVQHVVEIYRGARHGFAIPDVPAYDATAAERHWKALFQLLHEAFAKTL